MLQKQRVEENSEASPTNSRARVAGYIADLVGEMARLARRERMEPLGQALRRARDEARRIARST